MSSSNEDNWSTVPTKKNNKAQRDAVKAEKAAEAARLSALKAAERPVPKNKGTVVCRNFLSPEGCKRGDLCNFKHSHEPATTSGWRTTGAKPFSPEEDDDAVHHDHSHPFLSPIMRDRVERASKMDVPAELLADKRDVDYAPNPLEKIILAYLHNYHITPDFDASFQQADPNFINMRVDCRLDFAAEIAKPSLVDFSPEQLQKMEALLLSEKYVSEVASLGGIFNWSEGDFRNKTHPHFHARLRLCKFKLMQSEPGTRSALLEALLHTFEYTVGDMYFDVHPQVESDRSQTTFLNVRPVRTVDGAETEVFMVRRELDSMLLGLWDSLKSQHFNTLWFPFRGWTSAPGSWYKLTTDDHANDERYFHLFGFDDRELKKIVETDVNDKSTNKSAKFLRFVEETTVDKKHVKRRIKATKHRSEASKFYQDGADGALYLVHGVGTKETKQLVKCPLVRKRNLEEVDSSSNPYFREDLQSLQQLSLDTVHWNRKNDVDVSIEQLRDLVLVHPFLPIVALKNPTGDRKVAETLKRLQILLKGLRDPETGDCPGCEVILYLSNLCSNGEEDRDALVAKGPAGAGELGNKLSTALPGFSVEDFPADDVEEWKQITGYVWLMPAVFFQSGLLSADKLAVWLKKFEEKGEMFKVC